MALFFLGGKPDVFSKGYAKKQTLALGDLNLEGVASNWTMIDVPRDQLEMETVADPAFQAVQPVSGRPSEACGGLNRADKSSTYGTDKGIIKTKARHLVIKVV